MIYSLDYRREKSYNLLVTNYKQRGVFLDTFFDLLEKGRGGALMILQNAPDTSVYRAAVMNTALVDPRYDKQCEAARGRYILDLLDCFPDGDSMMCEILAQYAECTDAYAVGYYIENMKQWRDICHDAVLKTAEKMYTRLLGMLLKSPQNREGVDAERDAYSHVSLTIAEWDTERIQNILKDQLTLMRGGARFDTEDALHFWRCLPSAFAEVYQKALENVRDSDLSANEIMGKIQNRRMQNKASTKDAGSERSFPQNWREEIYSTASGAPSKRAKTYFAHASREDFAEMAEAVETESDPIVRNKLIRYMNHHIPREYFREYPRDPVPLLRELAESTDFPCPPCGGESINLRFFANYIGRIRHSAVRSYALSRMDAMFSSDLLKDSTLFEMWMSNYIPEDAGRLIECIRSLQNSEKLHDVGFTLLHDSPGVDMPRELLYFLYENTPCSICRERALTLIIEKSRNGRTAEDEAIIHESLHDCCENSRSIAKAHCHAL